MKFPIRYEHLRRAIDGVETTYLKRIVLGRLHLHLFYRGDGDEDPHDHPWAFWTFPLRSYVEEVFDPNTGAHRERIVEGFRWHHRAADFAHLVKGKLARGDRHSKFQTEPGKWLTLVWKAKKTRDWGFWTKRGWTPWTTYIAERKIKQ